MTTFRGDYRLTGACKNCGHHFEKHEHVGTKYRCPQEPTEQPKTVEEAVQRLVTELPKEGRDRISAMTEEKELYELHFGLGMAIRNAMGLWQGNDALLADCRRVAIENGQKLTPVEVEGLIHPDDASHVILVELWKKVRWK